MFWKTRKAQLMGFQSQFGSDAVARTALIIQEMDKSLFAIKSLAWFLGRTGPVDAKSFRAFAAACLTERKELLALSWNLRVWAVERPAFELMASGEGQGQIRITERAPDGRLVPASERDVYYPVFYIEPQSGNESALGFDVGSDPFRLAALERSRDTGSPAITEPIQLVQQSGEQGGFLIFVPVYKAGMPMTTVTDRTAALKGFAVGVYQVGVVITAALNGVEPTGLSLNLLDRSAPVGHQFVYRWDDKLKGRSSWKNIFFPALPKARITCEFGGRRWEVEMVARPAYMQQHCPISYWLVLPAGLVLGVLATLYVGTILSSRERMGLLAAQRAAELCQTREMLRLVLDAIPVRVYWKNRDSVYLGCNRRFAKDTALNSPEEIIGKTDFDLPWKEHAELYRGRDRQVIESGQPMLDYEQPQSINGQCLCLRQSKLPLRDANGNIIGVLSTYENITKRKQIEQRLAQSELKYRELVQCANSIILRWTRDGQITFLNEFGQKFFGFSEAEILGRHVVGTIVPENETTTNRDLRPLIQQISERPEAFEQNINENIRRNGERVWVAWTNKLVLNEKGGVKEILSIGSDITARRHAEAEIQRERNFTDAVLNSLPGVFYCYDETRRFLRWNKNFEKVTGYSASELSRLSPLDLFAGADKARVEERIQEVFDKGTAEVEAELVAKDGTRTPYYFTGLVTEINQRRHLVGVGIDISARKQAEAAIRELNTSLEERVNERTTELAVARDRAEAADRIKSAFLAAMSHELRTPLNSIIGFTGIILQGLAGPLNTEQRKQLEMVRTSARHLLSLINDVLDISKIEAGQIEIAPEFFDLREAIQEVTQTVSPLAVKKQLPLVIQVAPEVGQIKSDRRRVQQIMLNLLSNAIKFTEQGKITFKAESSPDGVRISVADTGPGIKPEDRVKLFQPFRQLDSGLTRKHEGTGLGLAISKRLIERLGGTISVESQWGEGSAFAFTLPSNR